MASRLEPDLPMSDRLPDWSTIERAYERMDRDQLLAELTRINGLLATQTRSVVSANVQLPDLDQPVLRSPRMAAPSRPSDHERRASRPSPPTALDLLISGGRMGPRLATKLMLASARSRRAR